MVPSPKAANSVPCYCRPVNAASGGGGTKFLARQLRRGCPTIEKVGSATVRDAAFGSMQDAGAHLNLLPTMCSQALSTTPDPTGKPRSRRRSRRIRSLLAPKQPTQAATAPLPLSFRGSPVFGFRLSACQ